MIDYDILFFPHKSPLGNIKLTPVLVSLETGTRLGLDITVDTIEEAFGITKALGIITNIEDSGGLEEVKDAVEKRDAETKDKKEE